MKQIGTIYRIVSEDATAENVRLELSRLEQVLRAKGFGVDAVCGSDNTIMTNHIVHAMAAAK